MPIDRTRLNFDDYISILCQRGTPVIDGKQSVDLKPAVHARFTRFHSEGQNSSLFRLSVNSVFMSSVRWGVSPISIDNNSVESYNL